MQTIQYKAFQDVFLLYRGGLKTADSGNDPYERYRVIPCEQIMYQDTPKDKTSFGFNMSRGALLFPRFNTSQYQNGKKRIAEFLCLSEDYKAKDTSVNLKLNACFTMDGRLVLFKDGCKPIRREKTYRTFTKIVEEWGDGHKQWGVRNPKYDIKYWEFKSNKDYIIVSVDARVLWHVLPLLYEQKLEKMLSDIRVSSHTMSNEAALAVQKVYFDTLWNIEPFSLDEPWDYTDEQKLYIKEFEDEVRQRRLKEMQELERRKSLPGYCDDCGAPNASYVIDPYAEEMYGTRNHCWLCSDCYHERCMDI